MINIKKASGTVRVIRNAQQEPQCNQRGNQSWKAYIDGVLVPLPGISKPVLVHVKGVEQPFDSNLNPYFQMQRLLRRV